MTVVPTVSIETPVAVPAKFNLLDTVGTQPLPAHAGYGVEVENINCGLGARTWYAPCALPEDPEDVEDKVADDGRVFNTFGPMVAYHMFKCRTVGSWDMGEEFAKRALDLGASYAIEAFLKTLIHEDPSSLALADTDGPATEPGLIATVANMEQRWASSRSGAQGYLHVDREVAIIGLAKGLFKEQGGRLQTGLGTVVIAGAGYNDMIAMTGPVRVYEGDVTVTDKTLTMPFNNEFTALAERLYVPTYECSPIYSDVVASE